MHKKKKKVGGGWRGEANYPLTQTRSKGASIQPGRKLLSSTWWIYQLLITFDANYLSTWVKNNKWLVLCSDRKLARKGKAGIAYFLKESVISGFVTSLETVFLYSCPEKMYNFAEEAVFSYVYNVTFTFPQSSVVSQDKRHFGLICTSYYLIWLVLASHLNNWKLLFWMQLTKSAAVPEYS